jgi:hypothetical protein
MKMALWQRLAVLTLLGWGISSFSNPVQAAQFEQQEIEQDKFIVLAAPGGDIGYKLLILEQLNSSRPCWNETGSNPSNVEPLLLTFDFTGICNRLVDSNSFSVRAAGEDQGLLYSLRILRKGEELVLVAASNRERDAQVEIGRTYGMPAGFSRIVLDPGWRLTRRAFDGRAVGHVYLTYDQPMDVLVANARRNSTFASRSPSMPAPTTSYPSSPSTDPDPTPDTGVIPVPSLPPAEVSPAELPPLPSRLPPITARPSPPSPLPAPTPTPAPRSGTAPSLSSILPPPPPPVSTPAPTSDPDPLGSSSSNSEPDATPTLEDANQAEVPDRSTPRSSSSGTRPTPTPVRPPTGVPSVSNSGGAPIRPRSLRQEAPPTNSTSTPRSATLSSRPPASTSPTSEGQSSTSEPQEATVAQAETYQVVVVADSAEVQDKVRELAPNAFLTTINGQVVMQVGLFRERSEADRLQQKLSLEGLPTAVIPVR